MRFFSILCLAFLVVFPARAEEIKASSHITAVTVYSDRATVTREAEIHLPAGASAIVIENLPASLFTDSLRAQGSAGASVTLGALDSKQVAAAELAAPRERELNDKLQALQDKRALVEAESAAIEERKNFLANLGQQAAKTTNENFAHMDLHPDQWSAASTAIYAGMGEALKAAAAQTVALRQIDEQITAAQADLNRLQTGQRSTIRVSVPVETSAATQLTFKLSYQLPSATWRPIYDARLDTASTKMTLTQFGEVRQSTGEDWTDVALTLSTAQPARGAVPPPLNTLWVSLFDPRESVRATNGSFDAMSLGQAHDKSGRMMQQLAAPAASIPGGAGAMAPVPVEAEFQSATIETGGYVSEYKIAGTETVTADNTARKVMIGSLDTSSTLLAQARPAVSANAFLMARTKLNGETPLLPGTANLFRDGVYIGSMRVPLLRPGEETTLSFGIDDQITVKRQILADIHGSAGLISKDNTLDRKTVTHLQNLHRFPVKVEVLEALPIGRDERIKLEILPDATTPGYAKDAENITGLAKWTLDLASNAKDEIKLGWHLSWPSDAQITGLP